VTSKHVVTAAHCLKDFPRGEKLTVVFGTNAKAGQVSLSNKREALKFLVHAGYNEAAMNEEEASRPPHDIAFITLKSAAPSGYSPVSVLTSRHALTDGETLTLAGFGLTSAWFGDSGKLRKVDVKLIEQSSVAQEIEFGESPGRSACMGDSGGPAFVKRNNKLVLVGVTSRGSSFCDDSGLYTDIRYHYDWMVAASR
jgi:secreted trypsin-like serine protease